MIATLPMYDRPEAREATDRFWALIREHLPNAPKELSRDGFHWTDRNLLLSQTCSLPFRTGLQDNVAIVATPVHKLDCPTGCYYSVIVVRADDERDSFEAFSNARLAVNSPVSQSGWAAIDEAAQDHGITFGSLVLTGAHNASAKAVAEGAADICALDAVSWSMIQRWDGFAHDLKVILQTPPSPALPYITAHGNDLEPLRDALAEAVDALSEEDKDILCMTAVAIVPTEIYTSLPIPPAPQFQTVSE